LRIRLFTLGLAGRVAKFAIPIAGCGCCLGPLSTQSRRSVHFSRITQQNLSTENIKLFCCASPLHNGGMKYGYARVSTDGQSKPRHHQHVAGIEVGEQAAELRAFGLRAARHFAEYFFASGFGELADLGLNAGSRSCSSGTRSSFSPELPYARPHITSR
jgi:hypothetical protein